MSIRGALRMMGESLQELLFPAQCLHCGVLIPVPPPVAGVCSNCLRTLEPLPEQRIRESVLDRLQPNYLDRIWVAFPFNPLIRDLLHSVKYQKMPNLGQALGAYVASRFAGQFPLPEGAIVLPVPLHPVRRKEREYNQSRRIARGLFRNSTAELWDDVLYRHRYTATQTKLNRAERRLNVQGAFEISGPERLRGKPVVVVDDVITTGATMNECARMLKSCGVASVTGVALAAPSRGAEREMGTRLQEI